jgi:hypothetical protein
MIARVILRSAAVVGFCVSLAACQTAPRDEIILSKKSPVELRVMQSRVFDTDDRKKTLRAAIAMLQDLGYTIDKVEPAAGTVSATKLATLRVTITVYPRGEKQTVVRANALVKIANVRQNQVDDPAFYQQRIFEPMAKAMFLTALQVEDKKSAGPAPTKAMLKSKPDANSAEAAPQSENN